MPFSHIYDKKTKVMVVSHGRCKTIENSALWYQMSNIVIPVPTQIANCLEWVKNLQGIRHTSSISHMRNSACLPK